MSSVLHADAAPARKSTRLPVGSGGARRPSLTARRRPRRLGAKLVPFGGWEMPLGLSHWHPGRAPGLPHGRRRLRCEPSGNGPRRRIRGPSNASTPYSRTISARSVPGGPSTRLAGRVPTRPCSTTSSCGGSNERALRRHAQRVEHVARGRVDRWGRRHRPNGPSSPCKAHGSQAVVAIVPDAAAVARFGVANLRLAGHHLHRGRQPATRGGRVECAVPAAVAESFLECGGRHRYHASGTRRPRHAAA